MRLYVYNFCFWTPYTTSCRPVLGSPAGVSPGPVQSNARIFFRKNFLLLIVLQVRGQKTWRWRASFEVYSCNTAIRTCNFHAYYCCIVKRSLRFAIEVRLCWVWSVENVCLWSAVIKLKNWRLFFRGFAVSVVITVAVWIDDALPRKLQRNSPYLFEIWTWWFSDIIWWG